MYLSHKIVIQIVQIETGLLKLSSHDPGNVYFDKILEQRIIFNILSISRYIGLSVSEKDALEIIKNKKLDTGDFRGTLIENYKTAYKLAISIAETKGVAITSNILLQLNHTISKDCAEDWQIKYRNKGEMMSVIYENFHQLVAPESRNISTIENIDKLLDEVQLTTQNRFYKLSCLIFQFLKIHPFIVFNSFTSSLVIDLFLIRFVGNSYNPISSVDFIYTNQSKIIEIANITDIPRQEVLWHELFLGYIAERYLEVTSEISEKGFIKPTHKSKPFLDINKRQMKILKYLQTIPTIKREDYVHMLGVSTMTAYRDLNQLVFHNLLKSIGSGRGTKYMLSSR